MAWQLRVLIALTENPRAQWPAPTPWLTAIHNSGDYRRLQIQCPPLTFKDTRHTHSECTDIHANKTFIYLKINKPQKHKSKWSRHRDPARATGKKQVTHLGPFRGIHKAKYPMCIGRDPTFREDCCCKRACPSST